MLANDFGAVPGNRRESFRVRGSLQQRVGERFLVALLHQNSAPPVLNRFRNSAMLGRENREAARHRFEHGIGNALLVSVAANFAGMKKNVRLIKEFAQLRLRNKPGKKNAVSNSELGRKLPQLISKRTFSRDREGRSRMARGKSREGAQAHAQSFLLNEPASLD